MIKKKVVVVGNCQARPIAKLLGLMSDEIEITKIAIVHLLKSDQESEYKSFFEDADYIISQLVAENYPCEFVRSASLKRKYGSKVVTILNLFFLGYTPDWFYIRIPGKGTLKGPMSDYHNKTIVESWIKGLSIREASELLTNIDYNISKYRSTLDQSLVELRLREECSDVKICDYITNEMFSERLFFTFNHPTKSLLTECSKRILQFISFEINTNFKLKSEPLNQLIPILNCGAGFEFPLDSNYKGVEVEILGSEILLGKAKKYETRELISIFYQIYSTNPEVIMNVTL